jgi:PKHD-type hydroxylase
MTNNRQFTRSTLWAFEADAVQNYAYMNGVFSKEECQKIIELGESLNPAIAKVNSDNIEDITTRQSQVSWMYPNQDNSWIFQRVIGNVLSLNSQYFNFDLYGLAEGFQFTRYDAPTGKYDAHIDKVLDGLPRKLSLTIQLSDPSEYEGGDLNLYIGPGMEPSTPEKQQGKLIAFPSYVLHQVTPVTKGTRYSLVCWVTGKPFK